VQLHVFFSCFIIFPKRKIYFFKNYDSHFYPLGKSHFFTALAPDPHPVRPVPLLQFFHRSGGFRHGQLSHDQGRFARRDWRGFQWMALFVSVTALGTSDFYDCTLW
jgi:hypothetical protein